MPFTLSHVAAVVPLVRRPDRWWAASGLVAGSMAPDVPFFAESLLPGAYEAGRTTHRWWAVPTVDVLLAAAMAAVWAGVLRRPAEDLLPVPGGGAAGPPPLRGPAGRAGVFALSAAVGAATHVAWDSFTHPGRLGVRALPVLARPVAAGVPGCTVLQYATSLVGLAVLAREAGRRAAPDAWAAAGRRAAPTAAVLAAAAAAGAAHRLRRRERAPIDELCFGAGAGLAVGAVGLAAVAGGAAADRSGA
ncbi:DUF4184 family protein, partial [Kitasatospora sp. NPDC059571]|uniref:DUF4184 family protein n=1 Tax=Kitasatospora sp. NPDC059571 TaxID=3346871 RepID=UPI0036994CDB